MNRFDNVSVSAYTPQSMQELAFTPMMKRQKHDEMSKNLAELSAIATDPLNEHRDEALQLKNNLESKLGNLSGDLANKGIDSIGISDFYKLQKERNDLIAPTGRIGQINAAKIAEAKAKDDFMKNSDKQFGQDRLEQKWLEHRAKYKGYDKDKNILNIENLGSPKYVDLDTGIKDVLSTLGSTTTEKLLNSGLQFKNTDHGVVMTNAQGSIVTETNDTQLNNALQSLKTRFINKTGEGRISRDFEGRSTNEDIEYINNRVLGAKTFKQNKDYKTTYDMLNPPKDNKNGDKEKTSMFNDAIQDPNSIKNLNKETGEIDFTKIGSKLGNTGGIGSTTTMGTSGGYTPQKSGTQTYKDVLPPTHQKFYETAAKRLIASGRLPKNADLNSTTNAEKIGFYMKNHMKFPTIASDIIRADVAIDNQLFSGNLASKDQNSRNATLTQDLRQTKKGLPLRTMIDVENGGKIKLEEGDTIDYLGVESPINYSSYNFENKFEQSVMGHRAQVLDSKGNVKANVVISRTRNEINDPTFKKMYEINQSYKSGLNNLGDWVRPSGKYSGNKELSKARIKVNDDNTFQIKMDGYEESPRMDNAQFIQQMQSIMEH